MFFLTCAARSTNGDGRPAPTGPETCQLWGWGRNTNSELLQPIGKGTKASYSGPVEIKGAVLGGLDPADIRSIQGGTTGSASGIAVTCAWGAWLCQEVCPIQCPCLSLSPVPLLPLPPAARYAPACWTCYDAPFACTSPPQFLGTCGHGVTT
jgi:hypothetical protein